jgi:hypothetical protein
MILGLAFKDMSFGFIFHGRRLGKDTEGQH